MKGDKYRNLRNWLSNNSSERVTLTFSKVEEILGFPLPWSAKTYTAWWANDSSHSQAVWLDAGYKTANPSDAVSKKQITFERVSYSPDENEKRYKNCDKGANASHETRKSLGKTLNDVVFKPWRNGTECNSTGYGLCVSKEHTRLFPKEWQEVFVEVVYKGESKILRFNLNASFWTTCPDIKNVRMHDWFRKANITWNGTKTKFETEYLVDNKFRIILG